MKEFTNEIKEEIPLRGIDENRTIRHPRVLGQSARESFTDYGNPRENVIRVVEGDNIQEAVNKLTAVGGGILQFKTGIYRLQHGFTIPSFVTVQGEGRDNTRLDFEDRDLQIKVEGTADSSDSTKTRNIRIKDLTVERSGNTTAAVDINYAKHFILDNVRFSDNAGSGLRIRASQQYTVFNCLSDNNDKHGFFLNGNASYNHISFSYVGCVATNNTLDGFTVDGDASNLTLLGGFVSCVSSNNSQDGFEVSTGLEARITFTACNANANGQRGFYNDSSIVSYVGCISRSNTNDGFSVDNVNCAINGCTSYGNGGDDYAATERVAFVGNTLEVGSTIQPSTLLDYDDVGIESLGNVGGNFRTLSVVSQMGNSASSTMTGGLTVVHAAVASGEAYGVTTTAGDDKVAGMTQGTTGANEYGRVLTEGYTTRLRVDGTTDIAIGDFIGTFTTAGIAAKVTSGMAFAIALEAYSTDDSNGEINAILINPRKVGSGVGASNLARAYLGTVQSVDSASSTQLALDTEDYDTDGDFDTTENHYTVLSAGKYEISASSQINGLADAKIIALQIKKNNGATLIAENRIHSTGAGDIRPTVTTEQSFSANDTIELFLEHNHGSARDAQAGSAVTWMAVKRIAD